MSNRDLIVIGGSAGAIAPSHEILSGLAAIRLSPYDVASAAGVLALSE